MSYQCQHISAYRRRLLRPRPSKLWATARQSHQPSWSVDNLAVMLPCLIGSIIYIGNKGVSAASVIPQVVLALSRSFLSLPPGWICQTHVQGNTKTEKNVP